MGKFLLLQVVIVACAGLNSALCQHYEQQQQFPAPTHYQIQQHHHHPTPRPQEPQQQHFQNFQPSAAPFDFDKFNQQAKQLQAQLHYFNQQQQKHIQQQINSVHQDGSEPHFDFAMGGNFTDLEKASEQFVNLGNMVGKQNSPKVIKITKTVAVKHPVPVPYPVPVVKVVKESHANSFQVSHPGHHGLHFIPTTEKPTDYSNFIKKYPTQSPAASESFHRQPTKAPTSSNNFQHQHAGLIREEFDTQPFYVQTSDKETIKIVPVPYYIDDEGNKHEISTSSSQSHDTDSEAFYPSKQSSQSSSSDGSGKFQSFTFSYHPPTPQTHPVSHSHHHQELQQQHQQQQHSRPETKFYYNHDSDNSASSQVDLTQHYSEEQSGDDHQHYQYKYVTYE